jgi:hypothetical protein
MFEVEGDRFDALQPRALGKAIEDVPEVEVSLGGQRQIRRAGSGDLVGEERAGNESHVVAALDEVLRNRQQRSDTTGHGNAGDDNG